MLAAHREEGQYCLDGKVMQCTVTYCSAEHERLKIDGVLLMKEVLMNKHFLL